MRAMQRKLAFVLAAANHGTMIVSRFDYHTAGPGQSFGVGHQILNRAAFDPGEIDLALQLLTLRRQHYGDGVTAIDCGANIGPHAIEWGIAMTGWGSVVAIEAQERLYYALAGNVALNNCFNVRAIHAAVGASSGVLNIPTPDYLQPGSLGSLELRRATNNEFIGQAIDYSPERATPVRMLTLDELDLPRVDLIKLDIEGMEMEGLAGAERLIAAHRPLILAETIKSDVAAMKAWLEARGYTTSPAGINLLAIHSDDKVRASIQYQGRPGAA